MELPSPFVLAKRLSNKLPDRQHFLPSTFQHSWQSPVWLLDLLDMNSWTIWDGKGWRLNRNSRTSDVSVISRNTDRLQNLGIWGRIAWLVAQGIVMECFKVSFGDASTDCDIRLATGIFRCRRLWRRRVVWRQRSERLFGISFSQLLIHIFRAQSWNVIRCD